MRFSFGLRIVFRRRIDFGRNISFRRRSFLERRSPAGLRGGGRRLLDNGGVRIDDRDSLLR